MEPITLAIEISSNLVVSVAGSYHGMHTVSVGFALAKIALEIWPIFREKSSLEISPF